MDRADPAAGKASPSFASIEDYKTTHDPTIACASRRSVPTDPRADGRSKLALIYATRALVRHAKLSANGKDGIRAIATHPGAVSTAQQVSWTQLLSQWSR